MGTVFLCLIMKYRILFLASMLFIFSCKNADEKKAKRINTYFDISGFIEAEMDSLQKLDPTIKKTIWVDGIPETQELKIIDWKKELLSFKSSDINKPAWVDSYKIDTLFGKDLNIVRYTATDDDVKIRFVELEIGIDNVECKNILIQSEEHNSVYNSSQRLSYKKGLGYAVESIQQVNFMDDRSYKIEVAFLK